MLGERIRKARMDKGLLIRELAALVGVTSDTVINWELRGVKPMGRSLSRLQGALEVIASGVWKGNRKSLRPVCQCGKICTEKRTYHVSGCERQAGRAPTALGIPWLPR